MTPSKRPHRIRLICWNADERGAKARQFRSVGYEVDDSPFDGPAALRALRSHPPEAVVIDLARIPSQGRDVGVALRSYRATRPVPIVFVDGDPAKVEQIKKVLPDATYTERARIRAALREAIAHPPAEPVAIRSRLAGYAATPLPKKLGIKAGMTVALIDAPKRFERTLSGLPEEVTIVRKHDAAGKLALWFVASHAVLRRNVRRMAASVGAPGLWIVWPKKASGVATDITQTEVRRAGLASGLVDYKIAAIDVTWTGLKFSRRKAR